MDAGSMNAGSRVAGSLRASHGAGATLHWMRRLLERGMPVLARSRAVRRLELIETLPLGGKRQLMLVACDGQRFLVGAGEGVHSIVAIDRAEGRGVHTDANTSKALNDGKRALTIPAGREPEAHRKREDGAADRTADTKELC
jgi:flagellar biogenesis protein FliO